MFTDSVVEDEMVRSGFAQIGESGKTSLKKSDQFRFADYQVLSIYILHSSYILLLFNLSIKLYRQKAKDILHLKFWSFLNFLSEISHNF